MQNTLLNRANQNPKSIKGNLFNQPKSSTNAKVQTPQTPQAPLQIKALTPLPPLPQAPLQIKGRIIKHSTRLSPVLNQGETVVESIFNHGLTVITSQKEQKEEQLRSTFNEMRSGDYQIRKRMEKNDFQSFNH